jgi:hypothetical protein
MKAICSAGRKVRFVTEVRSPRGHFIHNNYNTVEMLMRMVDDDGGGDDVVLMTTMTTLTARIQLLNLFLVYFEGPRFAEVYLI